MDDVDLVVDANLADNVLSEEVSSSGESDESNSSVTLEASEHENSTIAGKDANAEQDLDLIGKMEISELPQFVPLPHTEILGLGFFQANRMWLIAIATLTVLVLYSLAFLMVPILVSLGVQFIWIELGSGAISLLMLVVIYFAIETDRRRQVRRALQNLADDERHVLLNVLEWTRLSIKEHTSREK